MYLNKQSIYCGSAIDFMKLTKSNSADFIDVDPPYEKWKIFIKDGLINDINRVLTPIGNSLIWCTEFIGKGDLGVCDALLKDSKMYMQRIIWENSCKGNPLRGNTNALDFVGAHIFRAVKDKKFLKVPAHKRIFNFYCGEIIKKPSGLIKKTKSRGKYFEHENVFQGYGPACLKNVYSYPTHWSEYEPYQKPKPLIEIFSKAFLPNENCKAISLFGGSGPYIEYCHKHNIELITVENDQEKCVKLLEKYPYLGIFKF